jgi:hypothetical protein
VKAAIDVRTAFHEASHAVVRFVLGRACIYASAVTTEEYEGVEGGRVLPVTLGWDGRPLDKPFYDERERIALEDAVVVMLAGAIGEARQGVTKSPSLASPSLCQSCTTSLPT